MDVEQMPVEKAEEDANATGLLERGYLRYGNVSAHFLAPSVPG